MSDTNTKKENIEFDQLDHENKELLIKLPYRVGYWISQSDQTGGEESDRIELDTLESLITAYAQDMCKSEFMQRLMVHTIKRKDEWNNWKDELSNVPNECRLARYNVSSNLDEKGVAAFSENIFEIAVSVAEAFHEGSVEEEGANSAANITAGIKELYLRIVGIANALLGRGEDELTFASENISAQEEAVLKELGKILNM